MCYNYFSVHACAEKQSNGLDHNQHVPLASTMPTLRVKMEPLTQSEGGNDGFELDAGCLFLFTC